MASKANCVYKWIHSKTIITGWIPSCDDWLWTLNMGNMWVIQSQLNQRWLLGSTWLWWSYKHINPGWECASTWFKATIWKECKKDSQNCGMILAYYAVKWILLLLVTITGDLLCDSHFIKFILLHLHLVQLHKPTTTSRFSRTLV